MWTAGIDTSATLLEIRGRASGRLILFHLADPKVVVQHHLAALRPGGLLLAMDFDVGSARAEPNVPLAAEAIERMIAAFRSAGGRPEVIGARLAVLLAEAGLAEVQTFGIQAYLAQNNPRGPAMLSAVVQSLAPQIIAAGIATAEQLGLETFTERLTLAIRASNLFVIYPGAGGRMGPSTLIHRRLPGQLDRTQRCVAPRSMLA